MEHATTESSGPHLCPRTICSELCSPLPDRTFNSGRDRKFTPSLESRSKWWPNQICTLEQLREASRSGKYAFVALDVDWLNPGQLQGYDPLVSPVSAVGWAFVLGLSKQICQADPSRRLQRRARHLGLPLEKLRSLRVLLQTYGATVHKSEVLGRFNNSSHRRKGRRDPIPHREQSYFATPVSIKPPHLEQTQDDIVASFRETAEKQGKSLILVGFSMGEDLRRMYDQFPEVERHFSVWVDLGEVMTAACNTSHMPLLSYLSLLGYSGRDTANDWFISWTKTKCPANDALRTLALLEELQKPSLALQAEALGIMVPSGPNCRIPRLSSAAFPQGPATGQRLTRPPHADIYVFGRMGTRLPPSIDSIYTLGLFISRAGHESEEIIGYGFDVTAAEQDKMSNCFAGTGLGKRTKTKFTSLREHYRTGATVFFKDEESLEAFVQKMNGIVVDGITLLVERPISPNRLAGVQEERRQSPTEKKRTDPREAGT